MLRYKKVHYALHNFTFLRLAWTKNGSFLGIRVENDALKTLILCWRGQRHACDPRKSASSASSAC
jgi:hypothetical protein